MSRATHFCLLILSSCICINVAAQNPPDSAAPDSAHFDLGNHFVRKDAVQKITIKAAELERLPFDDLQQVISVYLSGVISIGSNFMYVIDGVYSNDANAFSIHDIEEITVLLDARSVTEISPDDTGVFVLITTRRRAAASRNGFKAAGATYLTDRQTGEPASGKSSTPLFHQYYVSGQHSVNKTWFGASGSYTRNVLPYVRQNKQSPPAGDAFNQYRLNTWVQQQIGSRHELNAGLHYTIQTNKSEIPLTELNLYHTAIQYQHYSPFKQKIFNPSLQFVSRFTNRLRNKLYVSYLSYDGNSDTHTALLHQQPVNETTMHLEREINQRQLVLRNNVSYRFSAGKWEFEPAVDVQFQRIRDYHYDGQETQLFSPGSETMYPGSSAYITAGTEMKPFLITPSAAFNFGKNLSVSGGVVINTGESQFSNKTVLPFATLKFSPVSLFFPSSSFELDLYGSYAATSFPKTAAQLLFAGSRPGDIPELPGAEIDYGNNYSQQFGAQTSFLRKRLALDYTYAQYSFTHFPLEGTLPSPDGFISYSIHTALKTETHRAAIHARVLEQPEFAWQTGLNATHESNRLDIANASGIEGLAPFKHGWTGGWHNRLRFGNFFAGLNVLYFLNEQYIVATNGSVQTISFKQAHTLNLQHLHAGFSMPAGKTGHLELYVSSRNLFQSKEAEHLYGEMAWHGVGAKLNIHGASR